MDKRYKITALCGMGLGTSSLARMAIMDYVKSHGIDATVTVADIGSVKSIFKERLNPRWARGFR